MLSDSIFDMITGPLQDGAEPDWEGLREDVEYYIKKDRTFEYGIDYLQRILDLIDNKDIEGLRNY